MADHAIPYRINLPEDQIPQQWYNLRADMPTLPPPLMNPGTHEPITTVPELAPIFCEELCRQELTTDRYIDIPWAIIDFYRMYRPSPLIRAYCLEETLGTPARIYYKFEGNNTSGSHKLN
ncbi:MAG: TrpB-like pyridoxal-phosphate dependent enzyme, partial [Propionibacteriaceae bacterium]|nr:TrpB-like pyridoxal-phosphate dependent enzyme [Propionibacteriaceae bacterium]